LIGGRLDRASESITPQSPWSNLCFE
jgi:hypothetical protein